jgi:hypothetical protein
MVREWLASLIRHALWTLTFSLGGYAGGAALIYAFAGLPLWLPFAGWAAVAAVVSGWLLRRRRQAGSALPSAT